MCKKQQNINAALLKVLVKFYPICDREIKILFEHSGGSIDRTIQALEAGLKKGTSPFVEVRKHETENINNPIQKVEDNDPLKSIILKGLRLKGYQVSEDTQDDFLRQNPIEIRYYPFKDTGMRLGGSYILSVKGKDFLEKRGSTYTYL